MKETKFSNTKNISSKHCCPDWTDINKYDSTKNTVTANYHWEFYLFEDLQNCGLLPV